MADPKIGKIKSKIEEDLNDLGEGFELQVEKLTKYPETLKQNQSFPRALEKATDELITFAQNLIKKINGCIEDLTAFYINLSPQDKESDDLLNKIISFMQGMVQFEDKLVFKSDIFKAQVAPYSDRKQIPTPTLADISYTITTFARALKENCIKLKISQEIFKKYV